jgi:DNA-binding NarL/FixJ family response regulator
LKRILLIEDLPEIRHWLTTLLRESFGDTTITLAVTIAEASVYLDELNFDLVIIDLKLPDGSGIDVLRSIKAKKLSAQCVIATAYDNDAQLLTALNSGADGYLLKDQSGDQLIRDLRGILNGSPPLSPPIARRIMKMAKHDPISLLLTPLSSREEQVLKLIAQGFSRKEIAFELSLSVNTIATHVGTIYSKLDISSRASATVEAIRRGLISA